MQEGNAVSKPKHVGLLNMCKRIGPTNMVKIAELTERAKGSRTTAAFAEVCGVNAGTMSRILNAKFRKNLSDDVIAAIAVNAANCNGRTFRELLEAHGLVIPAAEGLEDADQLYTDYLNQVRSAVEMSHRTKTNQTETTSERREALRTRIREIVQNDLIAKGYSVGKEKDREVMETAEFPWTADFVLKTDALEPEGLSRWAFAICEDVGHRFSWELQRLAGIAYFSRPAVNGVRITLITTDEATFYLSRRELKDLGPAYDSLSILLVNKRNRFVEAEYVLERDIETAQVMPMGKKDSEIDWQDFYGVPDLLD